MATSAFDVTLSVQATLVLDGVSFDVVASGSHHSTPPWTIGFSVDLGGPIDLKDLPLVGKVLPASETFTLDALQIVYPLVDPESPGGSPTSTLGISGKVTLAGLEKTLSFGLHESAKAASPHALPRDTSAAAPSVSGAHWFSVQKTFGPLYVGRVGVSYGGGVLAFLFDASLTAASLSLSLQGLSIGAKLKPIRPRFGLDGLGLDFSRGPLQIGGAFLRDIYTQDGTTITEYDGLAIISIKSFCLSAIGSYAELDNRPSLFVYAYLDYPIGGPSFFFITGLAAGFGVHRNLVLPPIDDVASFPLVAQAVTRGLTPPASSGPADNRSLLTQELASLHEWVPVDPEEDFFAIGVHFTTFKLLDTFALVALKFGHHFEVMVLGLSTLVVPTPLPGATTPTHAIAVAQMALEAYFDPSAGILAAQAQLTPESYVLSPDCHLTGGFAFYSWFSGLHAGDFVDTLGGYHPEFIVPSWYPTVPRLGFSWVLDSHISIKGYAYYAIAAHAQMAGGQLDAVFHAGPIKAWFIAGADFLIQWKPFHYDAHLYLDMGVSFTFWLFGTHHITFDQSIDLELWGPKFSGKARIHRWIVTFTVSFGSAPRNAEPIGWTEFKQSFLPSHSDIAPAQADIAAATGSPADSAQDSVCCSVAVVRGLLKTAKNLTIDGGAHDVWIINPKDFCIASSSLIPSNKPPTVNGQASVADPAANYHVGVAPMGGDVRLVSQHTVTLTRLNDAGPMDLTSTPVLKRVPAALWAKAAGIDLNGERFVDNAVMGCTVTPGNEPTPGLTLAVPRENLHFDIYHFNYHEAEPGQRGPLVWRPTPTFLRSTGNQTTLADSLVKQASARAAMLAGFGITKPDIAVDESAAGVFTVLPCLGQWVAKPSAEGQAARAGDQS